MKALILSVILFLVAGAGCAAIASMIAWIAGWDGGRGLGMLFGAWCGVAGGAVAVNDAGHYREVGR